MRSMKFIQVIDYLPEKNMTVIFKTRWTGEELEGIYDGENFISERDRLKKYDCFLDICEWRIK